MDRREFPRDRSAEVKIRLESMERVPRPDGEIFGILVNSSLRGLCIGVTTPLLKRDEVLRLFLPLMDQKTKVPTLGEVRWVKSNRLENGDGEYLVGVRYLL